MQALGSEIADLDGDRRALQARIGLLQQLSAFASFNDPDWRTIALEIDRLQEERRQLEEGSDVLKTLKAQLDGVEQAIAESQPQLDAATREHSKLEERRTEAERQRGAAEADVAALFPKLEAARPEALGEHRLTVEPCDGCERKMRDWLQGRIASPPPLLSQVESVTHVSGTFCHLCLGPLNAQKSGLSSNDSWCNLNRWYRLWY
jgi:uncharacterized protein YPO0396